MKRDFILIDDDPIFNFLTGKIVENSTCAGQITTFTEVDKAIKYINKISPDSKNEQIVFLDIRMPILDGFDFLELFQAQVPQSIADTCKIYMLTSSLNESDKQKAFSYPKVTGYLSKPLETEMMDKICKNEI